MLHSTRKFVVCIVATLAVMPVALSHAATRTAISTQRIADAMTLAGIAVRPSQIELLSPINSATASATMRVVSVRHGAAGTTKAKLRCQDNRECLPFYVLVHGVDLANGSGPRPEPAIQAQPNTIRGGDRATLILESPDSRMSLPVICLQSGTRGQKIRVTSLDRKRFFDAEVVSAGIVKGSL
ncbi:MAG: hypothetical protein WCF68_07295 [Terriglobales bacterium]